MLHLFECRHTKPLWAACLDFIRDIGCGQPDERLQGLIFGQWTDSKLGPPEARALLRHAFRALYRSLTLFEMENRPFVWQCVFKSALMAIKLALLRRAHKVTVQHANAAHASPSHHARPKDSDKFFPRLIDMEDQGSYALTPVFQTALENVETAAKAELTRREAARTARRQRRRN